MNILNFAKKVFRVISERVADEKGVASLPPLIKKQAEQVGDTKFVGAIYFPDALVNMYQLDQWLEIMRQLSATTPLVILTRNAATAVHLLKHNTIPVLNFRNTNAVEKWLEQQDQLRIVFYVNQNILNFQMLRFRQPAHVFISHGESDKDYMASNQLKAYDYTFIAGQAAHDRIEKLVHNFDPESRTIRIGRPQVDIDFQGPTLPDDDLVNVFYAPTWEGDRPSMRYSSVVSHGIEIVTQLVASGRHRLIYRPHPRTGVNDNRVDRANKQIQKILADANKRTLPDGRSPGHVIDIDSVFGWQLKAADVCISDISAVAFDWLATGKPLILTKPENLDAIIEENSLATRLGTLDAKQSSRIIEIIDESRAGSAESAKTNAAVAAHYFGDTTFGASSEKFQQAVRNVVDMRSKLLK